MKRFKGSFAVTALIMAVILAFSCLPVSAETAAANYTDNRSSNYNTVSAESLIKENGVWYYTVNGKKVNATTLVNYYGVWYYVENGKVNFNATTLHKYYGTWYYIEKGKINWNATTLCNYYGTWYYIEKGKINWNAETLCKYGNNWFYVKNGKVNWNATTLFKYYDTWYYVEYGKVNFNATTLCNYYGTWYYIEKGKINWNATTLCKYYNTWYYVEKGKLNWNATTLCKYYNTWYYVQNGKVNFNATTSYKYYGTWYNIVNGVVKFNYASTPAPNKVNYLNVGSGYIAEIVEYNAETFDGNVSSGSAVDWSRPTNNYLPKGTVDYCAAENFKYTDDITYATLRFGRRVYIDRKDKPNTEKEPVVKQYKGTLPNYNSINSTGFQNNGTHTVLTLGTSWKAPFYFDILPQSYKNASKQDYSISSATYNYIDITFCYATGFSGNITVPDNNPIFKGSELIFNKNSNGTVRDITLRLFLKKQGSFYGWDSYYNEKGQLCFEFLNPKTVKAANNEYGVDLNGAKILIDVGHGGIDPGAPGKNSTEAQQNLILAQKLKSELEKIGAKVYMTRTDNSTSSTDDKITYLKQIKPDYCIAIHHDSSTSSSANGFSSFYFNAFSANASNYVYQANKTLTSIYKNFKLGWHYYFTCRTTNCPVVLTENGFISNSFDYANITSDSVNNQKAKAITRGIVNYFKSIQ